MLKPVPLTVSAKAEDPAATDTGETLVIVCAAATAAVTSNTVSNRSSLLLRNQFTSWD